MTGRLIVSATSFPYGAAITASYTEQAAIIFDTDRTIDGPVLELNGSDVYTEEAIVYTLAAVGGLSDDSVKVRPGALTPISFTHFWSVQSSSFFAIARSLEENSTFEKTIDVLAYLDAYLAYRTFLVGHDLTAADLMLWGSMKGSWISYGFSISQNGYIILHNSISHTQVLLKLSDFSETDSLRIFCDGLPILKV